MPQKITLGNRIKKIRKLAKESQESFGEILGVTKSHISKIETDAARPSEQLIKSICRVFGIHDSWLINGEGDEPTRTKRPDSNNFKDNIEKDLIFKRYDDMISHINYGIDLINSLDSILEMLDRNYSDLLFTSQRKGFFHDNAVRYFQKKLITLQKYIQSLKFISDPGQED